ncbi:MAG: putative lipase [Nitrospirae bacterium]|nr:putative lipase [Nitrospirota bacterium]
MSHHGLSPLLNRIIIILATCILTISGCSYGNYYMRKAHWRQTFEYLPSVSALNQLAPEDSLVLIGQIIRLQKRQEPLLLVAVSNKYRTNEKVALVQIQKSSADYYMAFLPKGDYELFVFADMDRNGDFESNEMIGKTKVTVGPENSKGGVVVEGPSITVDFDHPGNVDFRLSETVRPTGYVYKSLDDEFFDPKYGTMGLYNPSDLIAHNQGFFFGLEDFNEEKTMVLFVHGISGTPRDWKYITDGLDRSRFQPFFFYYPSGLPLDKIGTLLAQLIETIDKTSKNGGPRIVLTAHSMGGLVSMSAINKLSEQAFPASLKLYCSFSTPYGGDETAKKWIDNAPVVVPSWRDIGAPSAFLNDLTSRPFPKKLPFYLYFSFNDDSNFKNGESSDGLVSLRSQLLPSVQTSATRVIGVDETHVGILNSKTTRDSFLRLLDTVSPPGSAGANMP